MACSPEITALIPLAVEVVLIAFRLGRLARTAARHVDLASTEDSPASWSYAIPGMTQPEAQAALATFNESKVQSITDTGGSNKANSCHRHFLNAVALT